MPAARTVWEARPTWEAPFQLMNDGATDLRVITALIPSPSRGLVAFEKAGTLRVVDGETGDEVLSEAGLKPHAWYDEDTLLVSTWVWNNAEAFFTLDLDGTEGAQLDPQDDYCTPAQHSLSPDQSEFVAVCGYGNGGELTTLDIAGNSVTVTPGMHIDVGKAPVWTANDFLVWHGKLNGKVYFASADAPDAPTEIDEPTSVIRPWGENRVLAVGQDTGPGGLIINAFRSIAIPSGEVTDIPWLTDENPVAAQIHLSEDETRVLYKKGGKVMARNLDGSGEVEIASGLPIQSVAW